MTDVIKTSPVSFPPSVALMVMIGKRAYDRAYGRLPEPGFKMTPAPRGAFLPWEKPATAEFYRMIDSINAGEQP